MNELRQENERLKQEIQELCQQLGEAQAMIKQLMEQLEQNSRNSSWPPSRDKCREKPKPKSRRQKSQRQAGATKLPDNPLQRIDPLYEAILDVGLAENPLPDTPPPM